MMAATNAGVSKTTGPTLSEDGLKAISTSIFGHLLERQVPQQAQLNALFATAVGAARFPFGSKRATYIGWIFQLSSRLGFGPDTGASAVVLMDRTLLVLGRACPRLPEDGTFIIPLSFLSIYFPFPSLTLGWPAVQCGKPPPCIYANVSSFLQLFLITYLLPLRKKNKKQYLPSFSFSP